LGRRPIYKEAVDRLKELGIALGLENIPEYPIPPFLEGKKNYCFGKIDLVWKMKNYGNIAGFEVHYSGWVDQAKKNVINLMQFYDEKTIDRGWGYGPKLLVVLLVTTTDEKDWRLKWAWEAYSKIFDVFSKWGMHRKIRLWSYCNGKLEEFEVGTQNQRLRKTITEMVLHKMLKV
jgi:hypothetical protein